MSNKHADEVGGMKVGHGDIPKWLYPVYIGLLLWAAYYFILDNNYNGYTRPKVETNTFAGLQAKYACDACHTNPAYPPLANAKVDFKTKEDLIKYLDNPSASPLTPNVALMQSTAVKFTAEEKQIIADYVMK